MVFSMN